MTDGSGSPEFDAAIAGDGIAGAWGIAFDTADISRFGGTGILTFAAVGDVDGDGLDDIAAGSRWASSRDFVTVGNFSVLSVEADTAQDGRAEAELLFRADATDSLLEGFSFSSTGNFDGDGNREFLVGRDPRVFAEDGQTDQGHHLFHEISVDGLKVGESLFSLGGTETDFAGDLNGDGFDDIFISRPDGHEILLGNAEGDTTRTVRVDGASGFGAFTFGRAVAGGQDLNGDGLDDFAALIRREPAVRVVHGRSELAEVDLNGSADGFRLALPGAPTNVEMLADFDGDGASDLLVSWRQGAAVLLDTAGLSGSLALSDLEEGSYLLIDLPGLNDVARAAGDLNDDGRDDINFSHRNPDGTVDVGVLFGGAEQPHRIGLGALDGANGFVITGATAGQSIGDVSGDGVDDLMLRTSSGTETQMSVLFGRPAAGAVLVEEAPAGLPGTDDGTANIQRGTAADDTLFGAATDDFMAGRRGDDRLFGGDGNDTLRGNAANDTLEGGQGADVLNGGDGQDTASYASAGSSVFVRLMTSDGLEGDALGDEVRFIEHLDGSAFADRLYGNDVANRLHGDAGNDRLQGHGGNDTLIGAAGDDTLVGGGGADVALGGDGDDAIRGMAGHDDLRGGDGNDHMDGGGGNDTLLGGAGGDRLYGQDGDDELNGEDGDDMLMDTGGNDVLSGGAGRDILLAGDGQDTLSGGDGDDQLRGEAGQDRLSGNDGDDELRGDTGEDALFGGRGADFLHGGEGADTLSGGEGADTLTGGAGADLFLIQTGSLTDTITDFNQTEGDRIDLTAFGASVDAVSVVRSGDDLILSGDGFSVVMLNAGAAAFPVEEAVLF